MNVVDTGYFAIFTLFIYDKNMTYIFLLENFLWESYRFRGEFSYEVHG